MREKPLAELEEAVMSVVWNNSECSIRDVQSSLQKERNLAYTTIATMLERLREKGLVKKNERGGVNTYSANLSKTIYTKLVAKYLFKNFFYSLGDAAIASFAESIDELPKEKREHFKSLLNKSIKK